VEPKNVADSGWALNSGYETPEHANDLSHYLLVPLNRMIAMDAALEILHDQPAGTELSRSNSGEPWRWIIDDKIVDEDGKLIVEM